MTPTKQKLFARESAVFPAIPGMTRLMKARPGERTALEARYPDAASAPRTAHAGQLKHHPPQAISACGVFHFLHGKICLKTCRKEGKSPPIFRQFCS